MNETHTSILAHYREQSSAVDEVYAAAIVGLDTQIAALQVERDDLIRAREKAQAGLDDEACRRLHVRLDENKFPVPRQGAPRKAKAAEPPALLPPCGTADPAIVAGVAEAQGVLTAPAGEAPTAADAFIADVSEPEARLYENGFSADEVAAMPVAERWALHRSNAQRKDVAKYPDGWREPIAGEDLPF